MVLAGDRMAIMLLMSSRVQKMCCPHHQQHPREYGGAVGYGQGLSDGMLGGGFAQDH